jgi:hypothetical protein
VWGSLKDPAARVYIFFPIDSGWRIKELIATVKYLSPVHNQKTLSQKAGEDWQKVQPIVAGARGLAGALGPVPGVGAIAAGAAPILSALAKLQIGSVPQGAKGYDWSAGKVTTGPSKSHGVRQGVVWTLPKVMFEELGGRLTGSLALSFIESRQQSDSSVAEWVPKPAPLMAHAVVYADDKEKWVPSQSSFVQLLLSPRVQKQPV